MSNIRQQGVKYLSRTHAGIEGIFIAVSKKYPPKESWTKSAAWWFDLPINRILDNLDKDYYLLCEDKGNSFHVLKLPVRFMKDHLDDFETRYHGMIRLHLESESKTLFVDQRGRGKIDLSKFLVP